MARSQIRYTVRDNLGKSLQNAKVFIYESGTTTPVSDLFTATSGGSPVSFLISDINGVVSGYLTSYRNVKGVATDNADTAYYPAAPGTLISFADQAVDPLPIVQNPDDEAANDTSLSTHIAGSANKHNASAIVFTPAGSISATNVADALAEVAAEAGSGDLATHLSDTTDAHDASAISFVPGSGLASTNLQDAVEEAATIGGFYKIPPTTGGDDTTMIQALLDASPDHVRWIFDSASTYTITAILVTKSLTLDLNGANFIVAPITKVITGVTGIAASIGQAAFQFVGSASHADPNGYGITGGVSEGALSITLGTPANASNLVRGDWISLRDSQTVANWDGSVIDPDTDGAYLGKREVHQVVDSNSTTGVVTLSSPTEFSHSTTVRVVKLNLLQSPRLIGNGARITETFNNNAGFVQGNDIVSFIYCLNAYAGDYFVDGYNGIVTVNDESINTVVERVVTKNPFRPNAGGHGYLGRHRAGARNGVFKHCTSFHSRHLVDWGNQSIDCRSEGNTGYWPWGAQFITHGLDAKRSVSLNDTVYGLGTGTVLANRNLYATDPNTDDNEELSESTPPWVHGNSAFNEDRGFLIINPTCYGTKNGIRAFSKSGPLTVINPNLHVYSRGIIAIDGAHDISVVGGEIEVSAASGSNYSILMQGTRAGVVPADFPINNVRVNGTRMKGTYSNMSFIGCSGSLRVENVVCPDRGSQITGIFCEVVNGDGTDTVASVPNHVRIQGNDLEGGWSKGIAVTNVPDKSLYVNFNKISKTTTTAIDIVSDATLVGYVSSNIMFKTSGSDIVLTGATNFLKVTDNNPDIAGYGEWDKPIIIGNDYMWIDADTKLRLKLNSAPTTDFDGYPVHAVAPGGGTQTTAYTLTLEDMGGSVDMSSTLPLIVTIPTLAWPNGAEIDIYRLGTGTVTVALAIGSGYTLNSKSGTVTVGPRYGRAKLHFRSGSSQWILSGDLA